ncbi:MAG: hypothetical protein KHW75_00155 [[Eubacterium] rectale]|nr:hypothetical protein [Agathobacter rectalis]
MISAVSATFFGDFSGCFAVVGELFCGFQRFQLLFPWSFPDFGLGWGAVLWISAVSATFFQNFSGCFAVVGELFCGFQQFQLLFSRIFPAFGLDWGAVLEVLWITATQGLPEISLRVLPL